MRVGLDIDNVITDLDKIFIKEALIWDKNIRGKGIIDSKASSILKLFDWTRDEIEDFFYNNIQRIAEFMEMRKCCKFYIDKLMEEGNEIFLITHRVRPNYRDPESVTINWLNKHKINYNQLIFSQSPNKTEECKKFNIDVMIDDRMDQCQIMSDNGVRCIVMKTRFMDKGENKLPIARSWKDLYNKIHNLKEKE